MYLMCMYIIVKQLKLLVNSECLVGSSPFQQLTTPLLLKLTCVATSCYSLYIPEINRNKENFMNGCAQFGLARIDCSVKSHSTYFWLS